MTMLDVLAAFLLSTKVLLAVLGVVFLASGIDDAFIDACQVAHTLRRRFTGSGPLHRITIDQLRGRPEQPVAVVIPAWDESAVIGRMLRTNLERIRYDNVHIFVGTYPNDPATNREVDAVREHHSNVHRVLCPKDGPTNKADCLNSILQGIRAFEGESGVRFEIFALSDSEDVIHPLCFSLFNCCIPAVDMVQLPVIPLEPRWWQFTSGHYLDEFAENHSKDMPVRGTLRGGIPGAGVACAFSRRAIDWSASNDELFSRQSLAEDYDFGMRLRAAGFRQAFVRVAVEGDKGRKEFIGVREYFPAEFVAAVRQKARWIVGISLQGWQRLGWRGDVAMKYALMRDRKGLITIPAVALGYLLVVAIVSIWAIQWLRPDFYRFPPIVERGSWLWYLITANAGFLSLRLAQRCRCTWQVHGPGQAVLALPRQVWGNLVNVVAMSRALRLFVRSLHTGHAVRWDKTSHTFPTTAARAAAGG